MSVGDKDTKVCGSGVKLCLSTMMVMQWLPPSKDPTAETAEAGVSKSDQSEGQCMFVQVL